MSNYENIKNKGFDTRSTEEVRRIASKGGIKSVETRRKRKSMREIAQAMGGAAVDVEKTAKALADIGMENSYDNAVVLALYQKAMKGNVKAIETLMQLVGQSTRPQEEIDNIKADTELKKARKEAITGEGTSGEALKRLDDILEGLKEDAVNSKR